MKRIIVILGAMILVLAAIRIDHHRPQSLETDPPATESAATPSPVIRSIRATVTHPPVSTSPTLESSSLFVLHERIADAPTWAIGYGREFWRQPTGPAPAPATQGRVAVSANVGDVIERVSHSFRSNEAGHPQVKSETYTATFDERSLRLSPKRYIGEVPIQEQSGQGSTVGTMADQPQTVSQFDPDPSTEAVFRTTAIRRGVDALYGEGSTTSPWSMLGNTAQRLLDAKAQCVEHFEARDEGVEVTWVLGQAPGGSGPLEIEAKLDGVTYFGESEKGILFADTTGTPRLYVGHVNYVDAAGLSGRLPLTVAGPHLTIHVPESLLVAAQYPLAIDPTIGTEFAVSPNFSAQQYNPSVGTISGEFLVAWTDSRNGNEDIIAARVSSDGTLLDANGLTIWSGSGIQFSPAVAGASSGYLVVWADGADYNIYGASVSGTSVSSRIDICTQSSIQHSPAVAWNGSKFMVVWSDQRNGSGYGYEDIYGVRVTSSYAKEGYDIAISTAAYAQLEPSVAGAGSTFVVVWKDKRAYYYADIWGARVSDTGSVLDSSGIQLSSASLEESSPSIAGFNDFGIGGQNFFVAWADTRSGNSDIYGRQFRIGGAGCGSAYCLGSELAIAVVSGSGQDSPAVAQAGRDFVVAWRDGRNSSTTGLDIYGATIRDPSNGNYATLCELPFVISNAANNQQNPAIAGDSSGSVFLVAHDSLYNSSSAKIRASTLVTGSNCAD